VGRQGDLTLICSEQIMESNRNLRFKATVGSKTQVAEDLYKVEFLLPAGASCDFEPGQFMSIAVQGFVRRSYSIANPPSEKGKLVTFVDTVPGGPGSVFFRELGEAREVDILAPLGHFLYVPDQNPVYFFATGVGIAPFVGMLRHELETIRSGREVALYYGVRHESQIIEPEMWSLLESKYPNFKFVPFVSRPSETWQGERGRITTAVSDLPTPKCDVYICGGREVVEEVEKLLLEKGVADERIYYERFY
ncbi:hypothetical protein KC640_02745, partial [Candidatus Dojkabacteria bacterium]|nr:hypothetical protein [Candidatus Dojkabacteria bacterium]